MEKVLKTIIADYGSAEIGKSSAIKEVYKEIKRKHPQLIKIRPTKGGDDILAFLEVDGIKIGIESMGDPGSRQKESLDEFLKIGCDIIIVACRTKNDTIENVRDIERKHGYQLIFAQHPINKSLKDSLNKLYAKHIVQMIDEIISGTL